jgi:hypothetical protein
MRPIRKDFSDRVVTQIDKDRRTAAQKARDAKVTSDAKTSAMRAIAGVGEADVVLHCEGVLEAVKDALCAHLDKEGAASTFGRFAHVSIYTGPIRKAAAEQAFAKRTKAANDRGEAE